MTPNHQPISYKWRELCDWIEEADRLYGEKRFSEALPLFMKIYDELKKYVGVVSVIGEEVLEDFPYNFWPIMDWLCLRIGFCLTDACEYEKALYYLEYVKRDNPTSFIEYINVLVNSLHPLALPVVNAYLENPLKLDEIVSTSEEKEMLRLYLRRRLGYLFIEYSLLNRAREIFSELLRIPSCRDFAQQELDYIGDLEATAEEDDDTE